MNRRTSGLGLVLALLSLCGCAALHRQSFTRSDLERAVVAGDRGVRQWVDIPDRDLAPWLRPDCARCARRIDILAISGGGAGGAFSAGLLKGWTARGTRPKFSIVTGVSTGALIAPFAFLGPEYDAHLESLYRSGIAEDLQRIRDPVNLLSGNGLLDPAPLEKLIESYATPDLIAQIGVEHRKGRRLFVVTTNLDAQRPMVWDIGRIASSGRPGSVKLLRQILLASASIPGVYPPVMIRSSVDGAEIDEMHVDGAATMQFFMPTAALSSADPAQRSEVVHLWVIINNTLPPEFSVINNSTVSVAYRSFSTLMKAHADQNAKLTEEIARRAQYDFNISFIDRSIVYDPIRPFGRDYMDRAFSAGEQQAISGTAWRKKVDGVRPLRSIEDAHSKHVY
jgi:predicted acylesterase/phospholipase RssA